MDENRKIIFSSYAHKTILGALVDRCADVCLNGSVDDILKLVPYALKVAKDADFEIENPDIVGSPFFEFGEAVAKEIRRQTLHEYDRGIREPV